MKKKNVIVHFACDSTGDHLAQTIKLIDSEKRAFPTAYDALCFAADCTECLNMEEIYAAVGADSVMPSKGLLAESLLLDLEEFEQYRE